MAVVQTLIGHIKGPKGDTGETGATGATGAAGADATVTVGSTTTVPYGQTARVTNTGTPGAAVFNFTIPQGKPGEQTTKLDALTLDALTEPSASFPVPAIGDDGSTLFGKISKWFSDMSALVATKFNAANVVNNLTTTSSGYALDARQGKALNDAFTTLNLVSATRITGQATTGATGNIALGNLPNDGMTAVVAPLASGTSTFLRAWVSPTNNTWFLTAVNPNTGEVLSNESISFRYWLLKFKKS